MEIKGFDETLELAPSLEYEKGEKIQQVYKEIGLYGYPNNAHLGTLYVTNFRLIWSDEESSCFGLHLSNIINIDIQNGFLRSSPKLLLTIKKESSITALQAINWECEICQYTNKIPGKCIQCGVVSKTTISCPSCTFLNKSESNKCEMCNNPLEKSIEIIHIKFSFRGKSVSIQDVQAYLQGIIDMKSWESSFERVISSSMGVTGILKSLEDASKKRDVAVSDESFKDLESLMEKAGEMTKLAESLISKLAKMNSDQELEPDSASFQKDLIDFGIIQPVTKETSGNKYFQDLAKELSNFLVSYSKKSGVGQYSLSDVFCLFNRARGIALVSPQDCYRASTQMKLLSLPFELKTYASGVNTLEIVQLDGQESLLDRILKLINKQEAVGFTASSIAASLNVSVIVAKEQLLVAETKNLVCRDDTIHGLFFFPNLFLK